MASPLSGRFYLKGMSRDRRSYHDAKVVELPPALKVFDTAHSAAGWSLGVQSDAQLEYSSAIETINAPL